MFCSSQFLSTLFVVRSARPRKKNSAAKNYDVEKKKIAYLARAVMSAFGTFESEMILCGNAGSDIVITIASRVREPGLLPSAAAEGPFVTTIWGGPLRGETWAGETWSMMIHNHAGAATRVAELVAAEADRSIWAGEK